MLKKMYSTNLGSTTMPNQSLLLAPTKMLLLLGFHEDPFTRRRTKCLFEKLTEITLHNK